MAKRDVSPAPWRVFGLAILGSVFGTGPASAEVIGVDAVHGFDGAAILATGSNFDTYRAVLQAMGHTLVPIHSFEAADLAGLDALFVNQPYFQNGAPFSNTEILAIQAFVMAGGGLVVTADVGSGVDRFNLDALVADFGIGFSNVSASPSGHVVSAFVPHPVTNGLGAVGVDAQAPISTSLPAIDLTVQNGEDNILAAYGIAGARAVFLSDTSLWADSNTLADTPITFGDNLLLLENILAYVTSGCRTLAFETADDFATPLVNGQHLDVEFGTFVSLSSSGANAGAAIFDSTPGGPNDPSQDRDLLVDSGNVLILQTENFPPDANDVFPRPNDDDDGGTLTFDFIAELSALSIKLIDVDSSDGTWHVVLTDSSGQRRTYTVPADWTGDLNAGQPGQGELDLSSLTPQPGFASSATVVEELGFNSLGVVRVEVQLGGSGAVDDLVVCLPGTQAPRAFVEAVNGSGVNPMILTCVTPAILGETFRADLDCQATGPGIALLEIRRDATAGNFTPYGEVLARGPVIQREARAHPGSACRFTWNVPMVPSLAGLSVHVQGLCTSASMRSAPKLRWCAGRLSNSLELGLGF